MEPGSSWAVLCHAGISHACVWFEMRKATKSHVLNNYNLKKKQIIHFFFFLHSYSQEEKQNKAIPLTDKKKGPSKQFPTILVEPTHPEKWTFTAAFLSHSAKPKTFSCSILTWCSRPPATVQNVTKTQQFPSCQPRATSSLTLDTWLQELPKMKLWAFSNHTNFRVTHQNMPAQKY